MNRDTVIKNALACGVKLLGTDYDQKPRNLVYPGGKFDCSMFVAACYRAAGFPLMDKSGAALATSMYEVNAIGFDLIYPSSMDDVGKILPSKKTILQDIGIQPGDIIFYNFERGTRRYNKITHVAMCYDAKRIIHTANDKEKCCLKTITYGDTDVVAVIRLSKDLSKYTEDKSVWRLQLLLNTYLKPCPKLVYDGEYGPKTKAAEDKVGANLWDKIVPISKATTPPKQNKPVFTRTLKLTMPRMQGEDVTVLQGLLKAAGFPKKNYWVVGTFDSKTDAAVRTFQKAKGLTADGIAGPITIAALGGVYEK